MSQGFIELARGTLGLCGIVRPSNPNGVVSPSAQVPRAGRVPTPFADWLGTEFLVVV